MNDKLKTRKMDLKKAKMCECCKETPLKDAAFYVIEISQAIVNHRAIQQFGGMQLMMGGNPILADMFVADRTIAEMLPRKEVHICQNCFLMKDHSLASYWSDE